MKRFLAYILLSAAVASTVIAATGSAPLGRGVEAVAENVATVTPGVGEMTLAVPGDKSQRFHIFSITGQMVKSIEVGAGDRQVVELPNGCYIVKCSQWSKKVVVR